MDAVEERHPENGPAVRSGDYQAAQACDLLERIPAATPR
jgi:hypothetical protein